jgi:hypothetical protein
LVEQYGSKLVCVRYRYDDELGVRYKTVELIVDEKPWTPPTAPHNPTDLVNVTIAPHESHLAEALKLLGGRYDRDTNTWLIAYAATTALRITNLITPIPPPLQTPPAPTPDHPRRRPYDEWADLQWRVGVGSK